VLLGWLVVGIGLVLISRAGMRERSLPQWAVWLFMLALPAWLVLMFTRVEWMGIPFVVTGVVAGVLAASPQRRRITQPGVA
jgi:hypothetical protein